MIQERLLGSNSYLRCKQLAFVCAVRCMLDKYLLQTTSGKYLLSTHFLNQPCARHRCQPGFGDCCCSCVQFRQRDTANAGSHYTWAWDLGIVDLGLAHLNKSANTYSNHVGQLSVGLLCFGWGSGFWQNK